jgi:aspartyl-tRNA(Asn)/glutamyl-tRNA(Gln) amidotransferase subunit A
VSAAGPADRSIAELAAALDSGVLTSVGVTERCLGRVGQLDGRLHSFLHVDRAGALAAAVESDRRRADGRSLGVLDGVPIGLKDNLCSRGLPTTCGSRILEGYVPPYDADAVARVRAAGAVIVGKLNMDEFGMGSSTENSAFGPTRNPWDLACSPGGSSGGAAAAVAAGLCMAALGSDTGGSVRQPASFCGVTALKPTYGRVSRRGLVAYGSSLDQVGPMARTVRDTAALLSVIAGHDPGDATSIARPVDDYRAACGKDVRGLRVAVLRLPERGIDGDVLAALDGSVELLRGLGCEISEVELPNLPHAVSVYYLTACAEASSNLARFDGMRYGLRVTGQDLRDTYARTRAAGFGAEVKRRIMLGTYALSAGYFDAYYLTAQRVRTLIKRDFDRAFERCDAVLCPTAPTPAFKLGELVDDPLQMYLQDVFTLPPSLAGLPALAVPAGQSAAGLPIGLQLIAPAFEEARLLQLGAAFEAALGWAERPPAVG